MFTMIPAGVKGASGGGTLSFVDAVKADNPDAFWLLNETGGTTAANAMGPSFPGLYSGVTLGGASLIPSDSSAKSALFSSPSSVAIPGSSTALRGSAVSYMIAFKHAATPSTYALLGNGISQPYLRVDGDNLDFLESHVSDRLHGNTTLVVGTTYLAHVTAAPGLGIKLYLNGVPDGATTAFAYDYTSSQNFAIGADTDGSGGMSEYSRTSMSHAAVWANTALTAAQILAHAKAAGY